VRTPWLSILLADLAGRVLCWLGRHERGGWWPDGPSSDGRWRRGCCRLPCSWREEVRCACELPENAGVMCRADQVVCTCGKSGRVAP
jgi:hypothetical protein